MMESLFRIGMGGHQQLGDEITVQFVEQQFEALLKDYRERAGRDGKELVACAALALGADRTFRRASGLLGLLRGEKWHGGALEEA